MNNNDHLWEDSYDTPCELCGQTPCYTLCNGDALCDRCVAGLNRLYEDIYKNRGRKDRYKTQMRGAHSG